ncbi:DUF2809 domain-containing protein [Xanthomonas floridensis]|uniref:DUF2809 domain-containing protein n=1 Tax=Xanthomonas floridensis TaxID=1843580 RepID=A0A1A9M6H1_9XANT|nr:DUF2809 domain-containing protein [Xanthomonas floridensis]MEA5122876.1 DUF2809 domain-containing protein [Xanthomonas floridensis]MEA5130708.1 DUF2809 domain-containing protein [Xanthomonas floridensis]OAG65925.1 hypothetical protein A7D17_05570 [Xanthomonas floridensis]
MNALSLRARAGYLLLAVVLFLIEVAIAAGWIGGTWVRGSLGDVLAVALVYCGLRGVCGTAPGWACLLAVGIGCAIEGLQAIHLADRLGLRPGSAAYIALGNTATLHDVLMYAIGGVVAFGCDTLLRQRRHAAPAAPLVD